MKKFPRVWLILFLVLLGLVIALYAPRVFRPATYEVEYLEEWTRNGEQTITLPAHLDNSTEGDTVLTAHLPEPLGKDQYLFFWTYYAEVEVLVEDTTIYHHNNVGTGAFGMAPSSG